jgi:O-antigen/teichoic acid export membrane protein
MTDATNNPPQQRGLKQVIGGSAFIFACRVFGAGATFVAQLLLARWMGASELGIYALAFSWCILLATLSTGGFRLASIRFIGEGLIHEDPGYIQKFMLRSRQFVLIVGTTIAVVGSGVLIAFPSTVDPAARPAFVVALLAVPIFAMLNLYAGFANALSRFPLSFLPGNVFRPLLFLAGIVAFWLAGGAASAATAITIHLVALAIVMAVTVVYSESRFRSIVGETSATHDTRLWIRTALPLLIAALYVGYFPELMVIMVGAFVPSEELAVFHICFRVAMLISFGLYAVDSFTGPRITELLTSGDKNALQEIVNLTTRLKFWGAAAAIVVLVLTGRWILGLFGDEFVYGYPVLLVLATSLLAQAAGGTVTRLISMSGHQDRTLYVFGTATVVAFVLVAVLVPRFGLMGAAVAVLLDTILWVVWLRRLVIRHLGITPSMM